MSDSCPVCGTPIDDQRRLVLVLGRGLLRDKGSEAHCSESCLGVTVHKRRMAAAATRRRWLLTTLLVVALPATARILWHRYRLPQVEVISSTPPEPLPEAAPVREPVPFGPAWPPTDADWIAAFANTRWIHPLPGPLRRGGTVDGRILGRPSSPPSHPATCREEGRCGVDLGGDLWGEHVYAVHDGIVDRVHGAGGEEPEGQSVRLSHFGGMVFTQYFHLAAIPRHVMRGVRVQAGDLIGLLGDTGLDGSARRHLHMALSVRPSKAFPEVYWDPTPWMADWPLRIPANGTVAGLAPPARAPEVAGRRRR